jgi:hypothetical protein
MSSVLQKARLHSQSFPTVSLAQYGSALLGWQQKSSARNAHVMLPHLPVPTPLVPPLASGGASGPESATTPPAPPTPAAPESCPALPEPPLTPALPPEPPLTPAAPPRLASVPPLPGFFAYRSSSLELPQATIITIVANDATAASLDTIRNESLPCMGRSCKVVRGSTGKRRPT